MPIRASVVNRLRRDESGFGLLELVMAMVVLNFGILALVAAFNSGAVALKRANEIATASGSRGASNPASRTRRAASSRRPGENPCQTTVPRRNTGGTVSPSASAARAGPRSRML